MPDCYLVVEDPAAPRAGDQALADRLAGGGYAVTLRDDAASAPSSVDLVVISESARTANTGSTYEQYGGPVVLLEGQLCDEMSLAQSAVQTLDTDLVIVDDAHPIADGLTGTVTGSTSQGDWRSASNFGPDVEVVARVAAAGVSTAVLYAYDVAGEGIGGFFQPARRVVFGAQDETVAVWAADAWTLFDAAVVWADPPDAGGAVAPTVDAGQDASATVDEPFTRTAVEDDGGAAITSREWEVTAGPAQVGQTIGTAATLLWTPTVVGVYTLTYTATNSVGPGSDTVDITVAAAPAAAPAEPSTTPTTVAEREQLIRAGVVRVGFDIDVLDDQLRRTGVAVGDRISVAYDGGFDVKIHRSVELVTEAQLDWGRQLIAPYVTIAGGGWVDRVPVGVFAVDEPTRDSGSPPTYTYRGYDLLIRLDRRLTAPISYPAGQPILFVVRELLAQHGFQSDRIDDIRAVDTLTEARTWTVEFAGTYLDCINDLLTMVGYDQLCMSVDGLPCAGPVTPADRRTPAWRYDAQESPTEILADGRSRIPADTDAPNLWMFWQADVERDDPPVPGDGLYVVRNDAEGAASIVATGGERRSPNDGPVESSSWADLKANADAVVAEEKFAAAGYRWRATPNPYHDHGDVVDAVDRDQAVAGRHLLTHWDLTIDESGGEMSLEAAAVTGGLVDASAFAVTDGQEIALTGTSPPPTGGFGSAPFGASGFGGTT